jgi:predicted DNA-binding transcriptional regulator YafY
VSARDQLERLLYVLPRAAHPDGADIADLARALEVEPSDILADIEEATERVFYHPGGMVDPLELSVEGDVVRLYGREFNRPVRLSSAEAMALGLGLRVLAAEAEPRKREEILALANLLEKELVTPDIALQPMLREDAPMIEYQPSVEVEFGEDDFRGDLAEAIAAQVYCDVVYLKADGSGPSARRIAPVRLVFAHGHWYVRAYGQESLRNYRLDRILELGATNEKHEYVDTPATDTAFSTDGGQPVTVRYSRDVARWVAEREDAQMEADGTLVVTHDVADMNWLVRHVLQYGGEAVVETAEARRAVAEAVRRSM